MIENQTGVTAFSIAMLDKDLSVSNLEQENGDDLLIESGDFILLEQ
jgi:hypothetical protein